MCYNKDDGKEKSMEVFKNIRKKCGRRNKVLEKKMTPMKGVFILVLEGMN